MKRAGFTMIELIFVIVILGILSAVALPRFIGVSEQAQAGKCKAFYGTLSRTAGPAIWSDMVLNNIPVATAFTADTIGAQIDIPIEADGCGTILQIVAGAVAGSNYTTAVAGVGYSVEAIAASANSAPVWIWTKTVTAAGGTGVN